MRRHWLGNKTTYILFSLFSFRVQVMGAAEYNTILKHAILMFFIAWNYKIVTGIKLLYFNTKLIVILCG